MRVGYFCIDEIVNNEECDKIIECGIPKLEPAKLMSYDNSVEEDNQTDIRKGRTHLFIPGNDIDTLLKKIVDSFAYFSEECLGCKISGVDGIQFTEYNSGDYYDWHYDQHGIGQQVDCPERIVSATIELSDPSDYEGGGLEFFAMGDPIPKVKKARMVIFPSTLPHRAQMVTKGTRYSLVMWGHQ
jgi:PKHD-type hydroxylase